MGDGVRSVRRFFRRHPTEPPQPSELLPILRVWLFLLAVGACAAAFGWETVSLTLLVGTVWAMFDEVTLGVRHGWPAFVAALAVGRGMNRLAQAAVPGSGSLWDEFCVNALCTAAALVTFVGVSRLRWRRR
ncbi:MULTISPECIES: hypothetical protein [Streptomyces]|uniref:Uncharacterized protein n=1 Tax=Streptomyces sviceus (strain ATCC 29083 / DSM 924 / JCM 4929 / NBRC 13980 / NCIMB 11184 / NRRL 5439 / UC 5370) TaxID=463191 RepID=B5HRC0_STRX2|nr:MULTISPECIES: hypothetical protein [Streptomyces]EDY55375.1 conserved hypothetical protein [Streptomyces sviceus ATCC 29083]